MVNTTKKSVRFALKYALKNDKMKCTTCRDEMKQLLEDIGLAVESGKELRGNIQVTKEGHFVYKIGAPKHTGPPVKEEKPKEAEGKPVAAEED